MTGLLLNLNLIIILIVFKEEKLIVKSKDITTLLYLILFLLIFASFVHAKPYQRFYTGVRPIGMGGAFAAVSDDRNAIFYNPAGLARIDKFTLGILNPIVGVGENGIDMFEDADDTDFDDTGEVTQLLRDYVGKHIHLHSSLSPQIGFKIDSFGVMVSAFAIATIDSQARNPAYPELHVDAAVDVGGIGGIGFEVPGIKGLKAGMAFKTISRESLKEIYTPAEIASDDFDDIIEDDRVSGNGSTFDIGIIYTLPWNKLVQTDLALVGQNLTEIEFEGDSKIPTEWIFGVSVRKNLGKVSILGAFDYRDVTENIDSDKDIGKRIHMGAEVKFFKKIAIRGGFNQGYPTMGASLDLWALKFDAAVYSEEVGAYAGQKEDKRFIGQITLGW